MKALLVSTDQSVHVYTFFDEYIRKQVSGITKSVFLPLHRLIDRSSGRSAPSDKFGVVFETSKTKIVW